MKHIAFKFLLLFLICSYSGFSQEKSLRSKANFNVLESKKELSQSDLDKINAFNFDEYRFYNLKKKVQLSNGPLIELLSIKELEEKGVVVDQDIVNTAKARSENFKHESILSLNIGLGVYPAHEPK